jgi:hypothetical protein
VIGPKSNTTGVLLRRGDQEHREIPLCVHRERAIEDTGRRWPSANQKEAKKNQTWWHFDFGHVTSRTVRK